MKKIILNWMPPALDYIPSPSMSVLKQYLVSNGFDVDVIYWNLLLSKLLKGFVWTEDLADKDMLSMYLLFNYLSIAYNDESAYKYIKTNLKSIKPQYIATSYDFFDQHMKKYSNLFEDAVNYHLSTIRWEDILFIGMSVNLYQWVASSIIAKKIKDRNPDLPVIIGGIGTKESAISYINNFSQFDIAIWGEGENSLLEVANQLKCGKYDFKNCSGVVYRNGRNILVSENKNRQYADLGSNDIQPDFSDYFRFKKSNNMDNIETKIPIEGGRGCHWNRCHFCFLNTGYKYRQKPIDILLNEIKLSIQRFNIYQFNFLDNDVIGRDKNQFHKLLSALIELKKQYPDFAITLAEIITNGINEQVIKDMVLAGFEYVQIGYESPSNELLKKIDKKNSFLSNLLFIKFANYYGITVGGANIIKGLFEETEDDIHEAIDNIHFLRFFLKINHFYHKLTPLGMFHSSKYYNKVADEVPKWNFHIIKSFIPKNYIKKENDNLTILLGGNLLQDNYLWQIFEKIEKHYLQNNYTYQIIGNGNTILYKEFFNSKVINELEFERDSKEWLILENVNSEVKSFDTVFSDINKKSTPATSEEFFEIIDVLEKENLLFCSKDKQTMVSIINTNSII
jgi:radical SAM superfamily enzyme YgiQ (UPF0313 family)